MDTSRLCLDTSVLIAFLKGREPGASAVARAVKDVLIGAICLEHNLPLLTLNDRHFARINGLTVLTPATLLAQK